MSNISVFFKFLNSQSVHTRDINTIKGGSGEYKASEWGDTRKKSLSFYSNPTLQNYFYMIFGDGGKIASASTLCEYFDFSKFTKLGDIGGVPFSQSWVIKTLFPHIKFVLTDYDRESLAKHSVCSPLRQEDCSFVHFDAISDDLSVFSDCDILTMWGVDYALQDLQLLRLIKLVELQKKPLLMATLDIDSKSTLKVIASQLYGTLLKAFGRSRYHGLLRNQSYIFRLCKSVNVNCELIIADKNFRIFRIN